jgi:hypothetical protein
MKQALTLTTSDKVNCVFRPKITPVDAISEVFSALKAEPQQAITNRSITINK